MKNALRPKTVWRVLAILWCALIFYQSSKPAPVSQKESMFIVRVLNSCITAVIGPGVITITDGMVRKSAHCAEYLILGLLLVPALNGGRKTGKLFWLALAAGIVYAVTDEVHQHFVPGRSMRALDVLIDGIGVFVGAGMRSLKLDKMRTTSDR